MKTLAGLITLMLCCSCYSKKELQVEMVNAELIRIDTVYRAPHDQQQLTWRDDMNIEYVSFAAITQTYRIGTKVLFLRSR